MKCRVVEYAYYRWLFSKAMRSLKKEEVRSEIVRAYAKDSKIVFVTQNGEKITYCPEVGWDAIRKGDKEMIIPPSLNLTQALESFRRGDYDNRRAREEWIEFMFR